MNLAPCGSCTPLPQSSHTVVDSAGEAGRTDVADVVDVADEIDEQLGADTVEDEEETVVEETALVTAALANRAATSGVMGRLITVILHEVGVSSMVVVAGMTGGETDANVIVEFSEEATIVVVKEDVDLAVVEVLRIHFSRTGARQPCEDFRGLPLGRELETIGEVVDVTVRRGVGLDLVRRSPLGV